MCKLCSNYDVPEVCDCFLMEVFFLIYPCGNAMKIVCKLCSNYEVPKVCDTAFWWGILCLACYWGFFFAYFHWFVPGASKYISALLIERGMASVWVFLKNIFIFKLYFSLQVHKFVLKKIYKTTAFTVFHFQLFDHFVLLLFPCNLISIFFNFYNIIPYYFLIYLKFWRICKN